MIPGPPRVLCSLACCAKGACVKSAVCLCQPVAQLLDERRVGGVPMQARPVALGLGAATELAERGDAGGRAGLVQLAADDLVDPEAIRVEAAALRRAGTDRRSDRPKASLF